VRYLVYYIIIKGLHFPENFKKIIVDF
jgi:hypothetical protein